MDISEQDRERLADVLKALGNPARLAILTTLYNGGNVNDVVDTTGITRSGVQRHVEVLIDSELVYRPSDSDSPYALTPIGHEWVEILDREAEDLFTVLDQVEREEEQVREQLELGDLPVDEKEIERAIHTRKWERLIDD